MFETQITKLLQDVQARSASILVEGDRLAIHNASKLPPELKEEIRRLKPQLLSELRNKNRADYDPVVAKALELFGGSVVKVMSVEEYQQRFKDDAELPKLIDWYSEQGRHNARHGD